MKIRADVPVQVYHAIRGCCALAVIVILLSLGLEWHRTKDYVKANAVISDIIKELDYGTGSDSRISTVRYIQCTYEVEQNTYHIRYRTFFTFGKHIGDHVTLYYDPTSPQSVVDHFRIEVCICGLVFLAVFILGMTSAIREKTS